MSARALTILISAVVAAMLLFGWAVLARPAASRLPDDPRAHLPRGPTPLDHGAFFPDALADGPAVTRRCLECHPGAAAEMMATAHWTWGSAHARAADGTGTVAVGKRNLQNNFCISVPGNWARCTSCHAGYGWKDDTFFAHAQPEHVDCLICHDTSGTYRKDPKGAGLPLASVDLQRAARSVGRTTRESCGACHFKGGGGDGVKHGDLDATMVFPPDRVDVHMGRHDLRCADCHRTEAHRIRGRLMPPEDEPEGRAACTDCHAARPHGDARLDDHVEALACQTCHVPRYAVDKGTKLWWDWSLAGRDGDPDEVAHALLEEIRGDPTALAALPAEVRRGLRRVGSDPDLHVHYAKKKGLFLVARNQVPEYRWYDGRTRRYLPGARHEGDGVLELNAPQGGPDTPGARIWPFKVHRGRQPFDTEHRHLLSPHVFGPGGYWDAFDWEAALRQGAEASGILFSGTWRWQETAMVWPQNHMVQSKERALRCADCHAEGGRMDWQALGYGGDPARGGTRRGAGGAR